MTDFSENGGFGSPNAEKTFAKQHRLSVELLATLALAVSLIIAATAVSIGVARAQAGYAVRLAGGTPAPLSALLGTMISGTRA